MDEKLHNITLEERKRLSVTQCSEVVSFNESEVVLITKDESLVITGENIKVEEVSKMSGDVVIVGDIIDSIIYKRSHGKRKEGFVGRIFK